jgi:hypothetical protein
MIVAPVNGSQFPALVEPLSREFNVHWEFPATEEDPLVSARRATAEFPPRPSVRQMLRRLAWSNKFPSVVEACCGFHAVACAADAATTSSCPSPQSPRTVASNARGQDPHRHPAGVRRDAGRSWGKHCAFQPLHAVR